MADLQSSVAQAKAAGYSGDEILAYLSKSRPDLNSKIQQARSAGYGVDDIVGHLATPAPSTASQLGDAASAFVGETLHLANPKTVVSGAGAMLAHPIDTITAGMQGFRDKAVQDIQNGDYLKALNHGVAGVIPVLGPAFGNTVDAIDAGDPSAVGRSAADLTAAKTVPEIYKGVGGALVAAAKASPGVAGSVVSAASNVANSPMVKAAGPVLLKQGIKTAATYVPVVGPMLRTGFDIWEAASKLQKMADTAKAATESEAPTAAAAQTPSAPPQVSTKVQIPTRFSVDSASDTMGTRAPSATPTPAPEAAPLDQATHQRLATSTAQLRALPHDAKVAVTQAMKDGDATKINAILDLGRVPTSSEMLHIVATNNKVATIMEYAQDHGIDLGSVPEESRDTIAHAAYANRLQKFAQQNGIDLNALSRQEIKAVAVQANLPKSGYSGTHEGSFGRINNILAGAN